MDAYIADGINRLDAERIVRHMTLVDWLSDDGSHWHRSKMADTLCGDGPATGADRAWLVGVLASRVPGLHFDGAPADCDWDGFYSHLRAAIMARRDADAPLVRVAENPVRDGVVSR